MSNIYGATALTGGGTKALDGSTYYDGDDLVDKDGAIVITESTMYAYHLDASSGAAENSPLVIKPDANAGTKRWLLKKGVFAGLTLYGNIVMPDGGTIGQAAGPLLTFNNAGDILGITGCKTGFGTLSPGALVHITDTAFPQLRVQNDDIDNPAGEGGIRFRSYGNDAILHADISLIGTGTDEGNLIFRLPHTVDQLNISHTGIVMGQAGEPRLNFDYGNDFLEITGCDVVIGGTTAGAKLDVIGGGIRVQGSTSPWPSGGEGLELLYATTIGDGEAIIQSYDRAGTSFMPLNIRGSEIRLEQGGVLMTALKSGANQGAAGAAVNELWRDTADNSIKLGV